METENEIPKGDLVKALAKAKKAFKPIVKNKEVKAGASFSYKYAELSQILDAITPALNDNDLVITQDVMGDVMVTRLMHSSGQVIKSSMPIVAGGKPGPQGYASSVTYARRYSVCNLLCISADDDLDAKDVQEEHEKPQGDTPRTQKSAISKAPTKSEVEKGLVKGTTASKSDIENLTAEIRKSNWTKGDVYEYLKKVSDKDKPVMELKDLSWFQCQAMLTSVKALRKGIHAG